MPPFLPQQVSTASAWPRHLERCRELGFDYLGCVNRAADPDHVELDPFTVRGRLPRIKIPLRHPDPDVVLDLPSIITHCYDNGAYAVRVDYDQPPPEPFRPDDEAWADALLRDAGLRGQRSGGVSEEAGA